MAEVILKVENLTKKYNGFTAVDHIDFEIRESEIVGLVGPNGAGKTTTIQILLSLLKPEQGQVIIFGKELFGNKQEILEKINFVAPYATLPYNLTPEENLNVFSLLYGLKRKKEENLALLREFRLFEFRKRRSGTLSSGEQTRLSLAKAFLNNPKLLFLDEPTAFLDPLVAREIREYIYQKIKASRGAALWTSHNMREIERICDRVLFLSRGKIIAQGTMKELQDRYQKADLEDIFISLYDNTLPKS